MGNDCSQSLVYGESIDNDISVSWKKVTDSPWPLREGQCACSIGSKIYIFGGVLIDSEAPVESNDLLVFDTESQNWSKIAAKGKIPDPRSAACLVSVGKKLYLYGGLNQDVGWCDDFYQFDTESDTWSAVESEGQKPSPRDKLQAVAISPCIYFFGGFGPKLAEEEFSEEDEEDVEEEIEGAHFGWFNDLYVFDTSTQKWSQPMQMNLGVPTARAAHAMCAVGRNLVIFGGRDTESRRNDIHIFNVDSRKWDTSLASKGRQPEPRSFHTATAIGNRVVVMGGRGLENQHFADLHIFDTDTKEWLQPKVTGDLPIKRGQHSAILAGNYLVLHGGSSGFSPDLMQCTEYHRDTYVLQKDEILKGGSKAKQINGHGTDDAVGHS